MHVVRVLGKLEPGGAQLAVLRLSRELLDRHAVRTTLLVGDASEDGIALARTFGLEPVVFRTGSHIAPIRNLQWQRSRRFAAWLADMIGEADLVHAHMVGAWWAAAQAVSASTPLMATEHNQVNWTQYQVASLRPAARRVDRFFAMGPAAHQFAITAGVRPDAIEAALSPIAGLGATPRHGLRSPRLTFAGRLSKDKGPDVLIEAISQLRREQLAVYMLGDGPLRTVLIDQVRRAGLDAQVVMPGWVDDPWSYLSGSTIHVVPSREEAWSQSAVLALGLGVPVVGTSVDGLRNTLDCSRGLTVAPDDAHALSSAIAQILDGHVTTDRSGGLEYAQRFSAARIADHYVDRYRTAITSHRGCTASVVDVAAVDDDGRHVRA